MMKSLKGGVLFGLLGLAGLAVVPSSARADRVLTEHEANKLTFSALIAPPSAFRHVTYRKLARHVSGTRLAALHQHRGTALHGHGVAVRTVAYHGHVVTRHRRNVHHRRG